MVDVMGQVLLMPAPAASLLKWDVNRKGPGFTLSNDDRTATGAVSENIMALYPITADSYWEFDVIAKAGGSLGLGVGVQGLALVSANNYTSLNLSYNANGLGSVPLNVSYTSGDRIGMAYRPSTGQLWCRKNGTWLGSDPTGAAALTLGSTAIGRTLYPMGFSTFPSNVVRIVGSPGDFENAAPAGFTPLMGDTVKPGLAWNASDISANMTLSEGNTRVTKSSTGIAGVRMGVDVADKWLNTKRVYAVRVEYDGLGASVKTVGVMDWNDVLSTTPGTNVGDFAIGYQSSGAVRRNNSLLTTYAAWGAVGDIVMVALDTTALKSWFGLNGTWNGDPAAGTGNLGYPDDGSDKHAFIAVSLSDTADSMKMIDYPYTVPTGFVVDGMALWINAQPAQSAAEDAVYSFTVTAAGGTAPYAYSLRTGTLPSGITLDAATGVVSGTPAGGSVGLYSDIIIRVTDSLGAVADLPVFYIYVYPSGTLWQFMAEDAMFDMSSTSRQFVSGSQLINEG